MRQPPSITFDAIYKRLYRKAFYFTKSYVHDESVAEDIASEALIKLWEHVKVQEINHPEAFLLTILKNKALDYLKHEAVKEDALKDLKTFYAGELQLRISLLEACNPEEVFTVEIQTIVQHTLTRFPEQTRLIFEMSHHENKSNKEIAEITGISVKSVEYHITKVLKSLRVNLKDYLPLFYFFFFFK
jgi:RNA polymerase sigma-70 factor (ECF subfamily)